MISDHVPCQEPLTLNLTLYVLSTYHKYLYLNLHGACNTGRHQITEKCLYWMPKVRGNQSIHLIRQNTMKASAFPMMGVAMILTTYLHNTHTFWDISIKTYHLHAVLTVLHRRRIACQPCWNGTPGTSCMECYRQPQTDVLLSAMNCCSKSDYLVLVNSIQCLQ